MIDREFMKIEICDKLNISEDRISDRYVCRNICLECKLTQQQGNRVARECEVEKHRVSLQNRETEEQKEKMQEKAEQTNNKLNKHKKKVSRGQKAAHNVWMSQIYPKVLHRLWVYKDFLIDGKKMNVDLYRVRNKFGKQLFNVAEKEYF